MNPTSIEWVKNPDGSQGFSSNPFTGCLNGCSYCYARRESWGRCKQADLRGTPIELGHDDDPFYPRFHPLRLSKIIGREKPSGIFLCDRSDWAASYWPMSWRAGLFAVIRQCPQHRFYLLTKQPQELPKFSPFPPNCWVGVTVTHAHMLIPALYALGDIEASVRFLSFEPLLEPVVPAVWPAEWDDIGWVIIGAQTKPYRPPRLKWAQEIVEAADMVGMPLFLKGNLWPLLNGSMKSVPLWAFGEESRLRQEMPLIVEV